jgi:hypothetical protein
VNLSAGGGQTSGRNVDVTTGTRAT